MGPEVGVSGWGRGGRRWNEGWRLVCCAEGFVRWLLRSRSWDGSSRVVGIGS